MEKIGSLIFYIISFTISSVLVSISIKEKYKKNRMPIIILGLIIPVFIGGMRYRVGTDFYSYEYMYNLNPWKIKNIELGMRLIVMLSQKLKNSQFIFQIYAILTVMFAYAALKKNEKDYGVGKCFFFYLILQYTSSFNIMRQILAATIVLYAANYIFEKRLIKYIFFIGIATMFHTTAILFLPMYFIVPKSKENLSKITQKQLVLILIIVIIIINYNNIMNRLVKIDIFAKYETYLENVETKNLTAILSLIWAIVFIFFRKRLVKLNSKNNVYIVFYLISTILMLSGYISPYVKRIAIYFSVFEIYLLEEMSKLFKGKQKNIVGFMIILYVIIRFTITAYILNQGNIIPYYSIFEKEIF